VLLLSTAWGRYVFEAYVKISKKHKYFEAFRTPGGFFCLIPDNNTNEENNGEAKAKVKSKKAEAW
jgi:hypothetical protein